MNDAPRFSRVLGHLGSPSASVRACRASERAAWDRTGRGRRGPQLSVSQLPTQQRGRKQGQEAEAAHPGPQPRGGCPSRSQQVLGHRSAATGLEGVGRRREGGWGGRQRGGASVSSGLQPRRESCTPTRPSEPRHLLGSRWRCRQLPGEVWARGAADCGRVGPPLPLPHPATQTVGGAGSLRARVLLVTAAPSTAVTGPSARSPASLSPLLRLQLVWRELIRLPQGGHRALGD